MNLKTHFLVFLLSSALVSIVHAKEGDLQPTPGPTEKPQTTSTEPPITTQPTTSTSEPTTSTPPPTTSTPKPTPPPTTSTPKPTPPLTTSTPKPTPPPTTPTPPPTTPTPAPTTPTPPPTPAPKPTEWIVRENNTICILANMVIDIDVKFPTKANKTGEKEFKIQKVEDAIATGVCFKHNQTLTLTTNESVVAEFLFVQNVINGTDASTYSLAKITLNVPADKLPDINTTDSQVVFTHHIEVFSLALNKSYSCAAENTLSLNGTTNNKPVSGDIILSSVHVEAFGKKDKASYSAAVECPHANPTPDIVPIVVGLVLAGLVIVVLIAYLVGRRRAQARGYLSM